MAASPESSHVEEDDGKDIKTVVDLSDSEAARAEKAADDAIASETSPPPPATATPLETADGGMRGWLQVFGCALVFGNIWGFTFTFGSFQSFFELHLLRSDSASTISWIGTIQVFLLIFGGVLTGGLFDRGYFKQMLFIGASVEVVGVFMTSLCHKWYQFFLAQGILMGLGCGLLYIPGMALVGRSFKKNRAIALAVTTCGAPVGGIIYTVLFQQLINRLGFGWTVRVMGFVMLGIYCIAFPLCLYRASNLGTLATSSTQHRRLIDLTAFRDPRFCSYTLASFLIFFGYITPFTYIPAYGETYLGLPQSPSLTANIAAQATSIGGRLIAGWTARRIGIMIPWTFCAMASGVLCLCWIQVSNKATFDAFAALYGFFSGALIPLPPSIFPVVCTDPKVFGARLGMAQGIGVIASLVGSPIAGALITKDKDGRENFLGLQLWSGLTEIAGGCLLVVLFFQLDRRRDPSKKGRSRLL